MKKICFWVLASVLTTSAWAKLPAPSDEAKAKAALSLLEKRPSKRMRAAATSGVKRIIQGAICVLIKTLAC